MTHGGGAASIGRQSGNLGKVRVAGMKQDGTSIRPDRQVVEGAYKILLNRNPESQDVIDYYLERGVLDLLETICGSAEYRQRLQRNPLYHYNSNFSCEEIIIRHARNDLVAAPGLCVNFLGARIDPKYMPSILSARAGTVEGLPIPGNWHADVAEWAAVLRAVELADRKFRMLELGCGWGCWMVNSGVAARSAGLSIELVGVEADEGHIEFAREACILNDFDKSVFWLHRGIVSAVSGTALFPRQKTSGEDWGNAPLFGVSDLDAREFVASGKYDSLPNICLADLIERHGQLSLLHIDIQGGEAEFVRATMADLCRAVSYLVIGTHSRQIEGRLFEYLLSAGWALEIERPAILSVDAGPNTLIDGVQAWRNTMLTNM